MVMWFTWVIWGELFLKNILLKIAQRPTQIHFVSYKQLSGRNGDHEWHRMTNAFILCDLVWKVKKSYEENREGSFKQKRLDEGSNQCTSYSLARSDGLEYILLSKEEVTCHSKVNEET